MSRLRRIVVVAFDDVELLDVTGPITVFASAARLLATSGVDLRAARAGYEVVVASPDGGMVTTVEGLRIMADCSLTRLRAPVDTVIVPGWGGYPPREPPKDLVEGVRRGARLARRTASVCTGAFLLAEAGLLHKRRVTTHWAACEILRRRFPSCRVDDDSIFVRDGSIWTSAGVTSGIDLSLALVEEDHGRDLALTVARWMVLYLKRPGGQSQFSVLLAGQAAEREPLQKLTAWMIEHPAEDLCLERLAERVGMSPRNFTRVFRKEVGISPAQFAERLRVEAARRALETTSHQVKRIAAECGFGTPETMDRVFRRVLRVRPLDYRGRFKLS